MPSIRTIVLLMIIASIFWNCNNQQSIPQSNSTDPDHAILYQELLSIEYALLSEDYNQALEHSSNLDEILKNGYNLFCPSESAQIDGARLTNQILVQHINKLKTNDLLDDLRILKGTIISLETDDDYDPYFAFLWRFEEDMYTTTQVAMDPMLDLFEWNEFNNMVACMKDSWQPLKMHFPSSEMLNNDPVKFKNQSVYKIYLEKAVNNFNQAVESADYQNYPLCDAAKQVRVAYKAYISTFIQAMKRSDSFLATL